MYDLLGRLIEQYQIGKAEAIEIGEDYPTGIYNIIVTQETHVKTLRLIKK